MISAQFDASSFIKDLNSAVGYSNGFLDGAKSAQPKMMKNVSYKVKEILYAFIDSMARTDPESLHHVYEWMQVGNSSARLYTLDCIVTGSRMSFSYEFSQSKSIKSGSNVPFYDKARIMESGIPVTIRPVKATTLVFEKDGRTIFTKKPIDVDTPGGPSVAGSFGETVKMFFDSYISQSLLDVTGIRSQLKDVSDFRKNFSSGKKGGYSVGFATGNKWMSKVGTIE